MRTCLLSGHLEGALQTLLDRWQTWPGFGDLKWLDFKWLTLTFLILFTLLFGICELLVWVSSCSKNRSAEVSHWPTKSWLRRSGISLSVSGRQVSFHFGTFFLRSNLVPLRKILRNQPSHQALSLLTWLLNRIYVAPKNALCFTSFCGFWLKYAEFPGLQPENLQGLHPQIRASSSFRFEPSGQVRRTMRTTFENKLVLFSRMIIERPKKAIILFHHNKHIW